LRRIEFQDEVGTGRVQVPQQDWDVVSSMAAKIYYDSGGVKGKLQDDLQNPMGIDNFPKSVPKGFDLPVLDQLEFVSDGKEFNEDWQILPKSYPTLLSYHQDKLSGEQFTHLRETHELKGPHIKIVSSMGVKESKVPIEMGNLRAVWKKNDPQRSYISLLKDNMLNHMPFSGYRQKYNSSREIVNSHGHGSRFDLLVKDGYDKFHENISYYGMSPQQNLKGLEHFLHNTIRAHVNEGSPTLTEEHVYLQNKFAVQNVSHNEKIKVNLKSNTGLLEGIQQNKIEDPKAYQESYTREPRFNLERDQEAYRQSNPELQSSAKDHIVEQPNLIGKTSVIMPNNVKEPKLYQQSNIEEPSVNQLNDVEEKNVRLQNNVRESKVVTHSRVEEPRDNQQRNDNSSKEVSRKDHNISQVFQPHVRVKNTTSLKYHSWSWLNLPLNNQSDDLKRTALNRPHSNARKNVTKPTTEEAKSYYDEDGWQVVSHGYKDLQQDKELSLPRYYYFICLIKRKVLFKVRKSLLLWIVKSWDFSSKFM